MNTSVESIDSLPKRRKKWTKDECDFLRFWWGEKTPNWIADKLGRTRISVECQARSMKVGGTNKEYYTFTEIAETTGYHVGRVKIAMIHLGIEKGKALQTTRKVGNKFRRSRISEENKDRIIEFLAGVPDFTKLKRPENDAKVGVWGIRSRPDACLHCKKTIRPHCAKGHCRQCYVYTLKWGENGRPAACLVCKRSDRRHHGRGVCSACHRRVLYNEKLAKRALERKEEQTMIMES